MVNINNEIDNINKEAIKLGIKVINKCSSNIVYFDVANKDNDSIVIQFSGITGKEKFMIVIYQVYLGKENEIKEHLKLESELGKLVIKLNSLLLKMKIYGYN